MRWFGKRKKQDVCRKIRALRFLIHFRRDIENRCLFYFFRVSLNEVAHCMRRNYEFCYSVDSGVKMSFDAALYYPNWTSVDLGK